MIITSKFVFLHLHKSGGSFVNECLLKFLADARREGYHLPHSMIPAPAMHLPVLGFVRNPWSYYVSWYAFQRTRVQPNVLYRILSEDGRLDFENTMRNMLDLGAGSDRLDVLLRLLPLAYTNQGLNLPGFALAPIRDSRLGFYSHLYRHIHGGASQRLVVGRMESLREDLPSMLGSVSQSVTDDMRRYIIEASPCNTSDHAPYGDYYSDSLRDLVALRDAELIERHGYEFSVRGSGKTPTRFPAARPLHSR